MHWICKKKKNKWIFHLWTARFSLRSREQCFFGNAWCEPRGEICSSKMLMLRKNMRESRRQQTLVVWSLAVVTIFRTTLVWKEWLWRTMNEITVLLGSWLHFLRIQPSGKTLAQTYACTLQRRSLEQDLDQGCATGGPRATTRPAKPFSVALANTLIFPHHAWKS